MTWWTQPESHTARVDHSCSWCGRVISPGERYTKSRGYEYRDAWTVKACPHCEALISVYDLYNVTGDPAEGISQDDITEWAHDRSDSLAEARAKHGFVNRWRRKGVLLPVPTDEAAA